MKPFDYDVPLSKPTFITRICVSRMDFAMTTNAKRDEVVRRSIRPIPVDMVNLKKIFAYLSFIKLNLCNLAMLTSFFTILRIHSMSTSIVRIAFTKIIRPISNTVFDSLRTAISTFKSAVLSFSFVEFESSEIKGSMAKVAFKRVPKTSTTFTFINNNLLHEAL